MTFWEEQPVWKGGKQSGKITTLTSESPVILPEDMSWDTTKDFKEVQTFLDLYYLMDDTGSFKTLYPLSLLELFPLNLAIRKNRQLIAYIAAMRINSEINGVRIPLAYVNFLCIHPHYRKQRLTPLIIKEHRERLLAHNISVAIFTSVKNLFKPNIVAQYWVRNLNPAKLQRVGFSNITKSMSLKKAKEFYSLPEVDMKMSKMEEKDISLVTELLNKDLNGSGIKQVFDNETVRRQLLNCDTVTCYLLSEGDAISVVSYFALPCASNKSRVEIAYLFHYAFNHDPIKVMRNVLSLVKTNFDAFICLNISRNLEFCNQLRFRTNDSKYINYYLYNWGFGGDSKQTNIVLI